MPFWPFFSIIFHFVGTSQLSSGDASDSICPKGWGIAKYNGDGSYEKLIKNDYGVNIRTEKLTIEYAEYSRSIRPDNPVTNLQLYYVRAGYYTHDEGTLYARETMGSFWIKRADVSRNIAKNLSFYSTRLYSTSANNKDRGMSLRRVAKMYFSHKKYVIIVSTARDINNLVERRKMEVSVEEIKINIKLKISPRKEKR